MLHPVDVQELERVLPAVLPYMIKIWDKSPIPISTDKVITELMEKRMQLFLCVDMKAKTKIQGCALFRVEDHLGVPVFNCFGWSHSNEYPREEHEADFETVDSLARWQGCDYVIGYGRRGFAKSLLPNGYKHMQTVMAKYVGDTT